MAPDTTNNSYLLEVDGTSCYIVGDGAIGANAWTWVNYKDGTATSKISQSLAAGSHTLKLIGREPSVKVDRVMAISDVNCTPDATGDNCASAVDSAAPTVSLASPTNNSTVNGTVAIAATASDDVGVSKVEFYVNNTLKVTDTNSPYSYNWDTATSPNGTYTVSARAYDTAGNSASDVRTVTVKNGDTEAPTAPTNVKATAIASNQVTVAWTASTDNIAVTGYTISRNGAPIGTATSPTYTDVTAAGGVAYTYQVAAYDAANNKSAGTSASVTTPQAADTQPPTAPTNLSAAAASPSQINLTWKASTDNNGVANYDVYRSSTGGQMSKIATVTSTSYGDTGLAANTSYTYYVVAKDGANNASQQSTIASAATQAAPTPPSNGGGSTDGNGGNNNGGGSEGQIPGDIRGKVTGRNGGAVSGARVVIVVDGKRYYATTNRNGIYRFYNLPVGRYDMRVSASDYESRTISIRIRNDNLTITNVQLRRQ